MSIQEKLVSFALERAYPYIKEQPPIKDFPDRISFILVGSSATGFCDEWSDVDICLLCGKDVFDTISEGTRWVEGRPTEVILDGTQLHYYAVSTDTLERKIAEADESACYVYGTAKVIDDAAGLYRSIAEKLRDPELLARRYAKETDMLRRRQRALHYVLDREKDPMARIGICAELIERLLKCTALCDGREYDCRKRLYQTALQGAAGEALKPDVDKLFSLIGPVCYAENKAEAFEFARVFDSCVDRVTRA